jgi:hypothetical protein
VEDLGDGGGLAAHDDRGWDINRSTSRQKSAEGVSVSGGDAHHKSRFGHLGRRLLAQSQQGSPGQSFDYMIVLISFNKCRENLLRLYIPGRGGGPGM